LADCGVLRAGTSVAFGQSCCYYGSNLFEKYDLNIWYPNFSYIRMLASITLHLVS